MVTTKTHGTTQVAQIKNVGAAAASCHMTDGTQTPATINQTSYKNDSTVEHSSS